MRIVNFDTPSGGRIGAIDGDTVIDLNYRSHAAEAKIWSASLTHNVSNHHHHD